LIGIGVSIRLAFAPLIAAPQQTISIEESSCAQRQIYPVCRPICTVRKGSAGILPAPRWTSRYPTCVGAKTLYRCTHAHAFRHPIREQAETPVLPCITSFRRTPIRDRRSIRQTLTLASRSALPGIAARPAQCWQLPSRQFLRLCR
jgi:hypothetical protein